MQHASRQPLYLRAAFLVLLALGLLVQPMLKSLGDLHGLEHAAALQSDHGHVHDGHDEPIGGDDPLGDPIGEHDLLHQGGPPAAMALLDPAFPFLSRILVGEPPDRDLATGPPASHLTLPFRPPIA